MRTTSAFFCCASLSSAVAMRAGSNGSASAVLTW